MLSKRRNQNHKICILKIDKTILNREGVILSDRNASSQYASFYEVEKGLKKIDFSLVYARDWIDKNKKLICKTFIEDEGMFYGLNDEIEKQLSKKEKAKIDDLEFSAPLTEDEFSNSLYIAYINFYIENEDDISCNFDLDCEPDYLFGHLANIELDEDNEILMSGING